MPKVGDYARDDVVTCALDDAVGGVGRRIESSPYPFGLVLSGGGVLLGRLRRACSTATRGCAPTR